MAAAGRARDSLDEMLNVARREHLIERYRRERNRIVIRHEGLDLVLSHEEAALLLSKMLQYLWRSPQREKKP